MMPRWIARLGERRRRRAAVIWAYRLFLDREPENRGVVARFASELASSEAIRRMFMGSEEFRMRVDRRPHPSLTGHEPAMEIERVANPTDVARLHEHISRTWSAFGESEAHFSVITDERFRGEQLPHHLDAFNASGKDGVDRLNAALRRAGVEASADATCFELGCGVGRVTAWLARQFREVIATDVSPAHLAIAREHLAAEGIGNVELHRLASIDALDALPSFGVFFSVIVLQHNPPPVMRAMLDRIFGRLADGGLAYFQVPTYRRGYRFRLKDYLAGEFGRSDMEMHVLPQHDILSLARSHGLDLLEVIEDPYTGMRSGEVSNSFLFRKRGG